MLGDDLNPKRKRGMGFFPSLALRVRVLRPGFLQSTLDPFFLLERKLRTKPIVGPSPAFASSGSESLVAQPRYPREGDRAVLLKRRRLARDDFWGVKGNLHSHQPGRVGDRTLERCLVQPFARLTPVCRRIRLHPFAERQAAT